MRKRSFLFNLCLFHSLGHDYNVVRGPVNETKIKRKGNAVMRPQSLTGHYVTGASAFHKELTLRKSLDCVAL